MKRARDTGITISCAIRSPDADVVGLVGVGVQQGGLDLAAVSGVDRARGVDDRDPVLGGQAAAGDDEGDVALGQRDAHAGADERALPGLEPQRLGGRRDRPPRRRGARTPERRGR